MDLARIRSGAIDMLPDEQEAELRRGMSRQETRDPYIVGWDGDDDPENPFNWPSWKKWTITILVALVTFNVAFGSSAFTAGMPDIEVEFGASNTVITLGVTFYLLGFAFGPLLYAPLSEIYGRKPIAIYPWIIFMAFQIGCALSHNTATLLVSRLIAGFAGASPITNAGATLGDMFVPAERGTPMSFYTIAPFMGPVFGPIVGGFVSEYVSWRWTFWIVLIMSGVMFIGQLLCPETYGRTLLARKAARLRKETGNMNLHAAHEIGQASQWEVIKNNISRPVVMLCTEPIVFLFALYCAIIYAILYMDFIAYPIVYQEERGWSAGIGGLPFLGVGIGMWIGIATSGHQTTIYIRLTKQRNKGIYPEARLPYAIAGAIAIPIGIFWFGWTSIRSVHWIVSILSGIPFGFGMCTVYICSFAYLVDAYLMYAASSLAANSLLRSIFGACFPLFARQMYENLEPKWASTLVGGIAALAAPIPLLFYKYGESIRMRSVRLPETSKV
ncbi:major facilitator superfamily domain-containing protein [Lipomyces oligophaga]|uniref:major facilitator superfamily domain-containing protein n=1 Tax=Lipomyces oligophaga TaxID=45792 RepID=UPI0034CE3BC7